MDEQLYVVEALSSRWSHIVKFWKDQENGEKKCVDRYLIIRNVLWYHVKLHKNKLYRKEMWSLREEKYVMLEKEFPFLLIYLSYITFFTRWCEYINTHTHRHWSATTNCNCYKFNFIVSIAFCISQHFFLSHNKEI